MATLTLRCAWIGVLVFLCLSFSNAHRALLDNNYGQGNGVGYGTGTGSVIGSATSGNSNSDINKATIGVGTIAGYPPPGANIGGDDQLYRTVPSLNPPTKSANGSELKPLDTSDDLRKALIEGGGPDPPSPNTSDDLRKALIEGGGPDPPSPNTSDDLRKALIEGGGPDPPSPNTSDGLRRPPSEGGDPPPDATYIDPASPPDDIDLLIPYPPLPSQDGPPAVIP